MKFKALYIGALVASLFSCGGSQEASTEGGTEVLKGNISIDGSSTVYPISAGIAELFGEEQPEVKVMVGQSGTGGGFTKFAAGETQISDASRPIKEGEAQDCAKNKIKYQQLTVAYDGLAVLVNPKNTWVDKLTVEELKKIWANSPTKAMTWADVRTGWPAEKISLYGPGTASGTYDYFNEEILGKGVAARTDYNASENDNMLVKGIADDKNALGYFGFAYYAENKDKLKLVAIDAGKGAILPSEQTVMDKTYSPLSRPIFIYVSDAAKKQAEVRAFVDFYLVNALEVSKMVGYIQMTADEQKAQVEIFKAFCEEK
jgi:phosphate transport system substrate-binding protein